MSYWEQTNFKLVDALNTEMWTQSPQLQRTIQPPHELIQPGSIGAQQAMLENNSEAILPWVPDIVGKEAEGGRTILIFGASYAGFIREYSCRNACLRLADYLQAANWAEFQRCFLDNVVVSDAAYYGKLASLLSSAGIPASRIILSDLCTNSIVRRCAINNRRQDDSRQPCKDRAEVFHRYVKNPVVAGWTWRRITECGAKRIIALGHIAEHGLLRLFNRHGATIFCNGHQWVAKEYSPPFCWVDNYADPDKKLSYWLNPGIWWTILVQGKELRLLPIYHPASQGKRDSSYSATRKALAVWLKENP